EILASIRRIISEDGEEEDAPIVPAGAPGRPSPLRPPALAAEPALPDDDDTSEIHLRTEDVEMVKKNTVEAMQDEGEEEILDEGAAAAASKAFHSLSQSVRVSAGDGRTLEDIVVDMLRPMVKEWLDSNLPAIVEEKVEEEVQRVARRRR
ncbi:MAG: PopZ family protein, partial [Amphiplicatus sp.]